MTESNGLVVHPDTLRERFVRFAKVAGVRPLVLHGTRHSFVTIALAAGIRPDVVSRALGHASTGFTLDVYVHPDEAEQLQAADMLADALAQRDGGSPGETTKPAIRLVRPRAYRSRR